ncbi:hypothetical protein PHYBLDRAFT_174687 [Phycomyces blakesleeanus NRRL 1555(-)]|uniref:Uncharacterized protein n=1 Tax=Phycomyces blakesleeanus (strain ATCC 8743b / DSM 1359 / FGSC 10004 / NBRC 33097 / NRRL 1555) TaxID=763407 RepID=A0A167JZN0_PHYB8|nr:hypothetical protein PHYBLDRAFT_174687 [Phycomyces blakesleeanus NRRL 1555(-)]OAD66980.1 hypothetical protein PHYBLDRAFT_174687 [Phycomyces blakesleeanus NRRL 1555(-)]|eukprot:XP_018285020.1 hypothetical protein PHYBLDRAFT_174687 [Phycomyces blakesleeanus NRRL 1555(-)]
MAPIRKPTVRKECRCSISHEDTCDTISSVVSEPVNQEEDSFEFEQEDVEMNSELRNLNDTNDILDIRTRNQPFSETDCVFGPEDNVQYTSDTYEEEYEDESDVEMDNDEDSSLESISELNLIHQFIVISVALFVSLYVVDEGAVSLIAIINKILQFLFDPFRLPVSVAGLKRLAGFEALTSGVKKYVACSECHAIYDNEAAPLCCTSPNFGTAKRMMERWVADGIIDDKKLVAMQKAVEKIVLLPDYISLGTKIAKGFPYMKADENWMLFIKACRILVMPNICESDIATAHKYLEDFCKNQLYQHHTGHINIDERQRTTLTNYIPINKETNVINVNNIHYQVAYNDRRISNCKNDMTSSAFVNDQIEVIKSIEILGQVYKGCNGNGRGSYIQALFQENRTNACYDYISEIQYIFVHSFTPTKSSTTLYNHNHQHIFAFVK